MKTMMKKTCYALMSALMMLVVSCNEGEYNVHQTFFYPQKPYGLQLYADQTSDTTNVYSVDPWTSSTTGSWFTTNPVNSQTGFFTHITISTTPNNTGKNRQGLINIHAHETIAMAVMQSTWLNITYPAPRINNEVDFEDRKAIFEGLADDDEHTTQVAFYVYQDDATLVSNTPWMIPQEATFEKGYHQVKVDIAKNPEEKKRTGTLTLTSGGISSTITIVQAEQVDEEKEGK